MVDKELVLTGLRIRLAHHTDLDDTTVRGVELISNPSNPLQWLANVTVVDTGNPPSLSLPGRTVPYHPIWWRMVAGHCKPCR